MAQEINIWLAIAMTTISIITALFGGLAFIWRLGGKFSSTLTTLNTSIDNLNTHLVKVDAKADSNANIVRNHEIRLVIIERELKIESSLPDKKEYGGNVHEN